MVDADKTAARYRLSFRPGSVAYVAMWPAFNTGPRGMAQRSGLFLRNFFSSLNFEPNLFFLSRLQNHPFSLLKLTKPFI